MLSWLFYGSVCCPPGKIEAAWVGFLTFVKGVSKNLRKYSHPIYLILILVPLFSRVKDRSKGAKYFGLVGFQLL